MTANDPKTIDEISADQSLGLIREFWSFLLHNKKFWLLPIIIIFILFGFIIIFGGSSAAPFIYPFF